MEAISQVRKVAGEKTFVSGLSAVVTDTRQLVEDQEAIYVAIAVALCAVVLMLTMDSFLLPLIFLLCIAVSVLWNTWANYFLKSAILPAAAVLHMTLDFPFDQIARAAGDLVRNHFPNNSAAFFILSAIGTPNGHLGSHCLHPIHSEAVLPSCI